MARCEDYPCCGHGPPPHGDGGGCPDSEGRFRCVLCGRKMPRNASSSICGTAACNRAERARQAREEQGFFDDYDR